MWKLYVKYEREFDSLSTFNPITLLNASKAAANAAGVPLQPINVDLAHAVVEDSARTSWYRTQRYYTEQVGMGPGGPVQQLREDLMSEGWMS